MEERQKRPHLSNEMKNRLGQWLLQHSNNGSLQYGATKEAVELFNVNPRTIYRHWNEAKAQLSLGKPIHLVNHKKGSKNKLIKKLDTEKVKKMSMLERSSLRQMSGHLGVSKSLLHIWIKQKQLRTHTNAIKPYLTAQNMINRLAWSLSQLNPIIADGKVPFHTMHNIIHVDEKWFYLTKIAGRYYVLPDEIDPHRTCKSKRFIEKIMFLCAVARPIIDTDGTVLFDGKIGIYPFICKEPALRNSKNRQKGTLETKAIQAITQEVIRDCFINWLIPTIKAKWPAHLSKEIFIQQDNAKPHIKADDPVFIEAATSDGFNIKIICQPANSPDSNVCDLGFFRAIQTLKDRKMAKTVDDMVKNVLDSFEEFEPWKLNNVFLTLQSCYGEITKKRGNNNYKIPHLGKEKLMRLGMLPETLEVEEQLVIESASYLRLQELKPSSGYRADTLLDGLQQFRLDSIIRGINQVAF